MLPAQVDERVVGAYIDEIFLQIILLEVDHRRHLVACLRQEIENVAEIILEKSLADSPLHSPADHLLGAAEPVPDLQRALGEADRARADRDGVVVVEKDGRDAAARQIERVGEADRPGADHDDGMAGGTPLFLLGGPTIGKFRIEVGRQHSVRPSHNRVAARSRRMGVRLFRR